MTEEPLVEKKCSRCKKFNWDSLTGIYNETCKDGEPCDADGAVYIEGELQEVKLMTDPVDPDETPEEMNERMQREVEEEAAREDEG